MSYINIIGTLKADPNVLQLPGKNTTRLSFKAEGPGTVEVIYTIDTINCARFIEKGKLKDKIKRTAYLLPYEGIEVEHEVAIDVRPTCVEKDKEAFKIHCRIIKKNEKNKVDAETTDVCLCSYIKSESS